LRGVCKIQSMGHTLHSCCFFSSWRRALQSALDVWRVKKGSVPFALIHSSTRRLIGMLSWNEMSDLHLDPRLWVELVLVGKKKPIFYFVLQRSRTDANNFDKDFTSEDPVLTPLDAKHLAEINQDEFCGFSYVNPDFGKLCHEGGGRSSSQPNIVPSNNTRREKTPPASAQSSTDNHTPNTDNGSRSNSPSLPKPPSWQLSFKPGIWCLC
jgi:hypothetical protein